MSTSEDSVTNQYINESYLATEDEDVDEGSDDDSNSDVVSKMLREQDRFLPICNIIKIMKRAIPDNGKVAKDARECIQECVSEFISFITSEAIDRSHGENRKTVNGDDLLYAFSSLGFDNYLEPLTMYLHKYRESTKSDRNIIYQDTVYFEDSSNDFKSKPNGSTTAITAASTNHKPEGSRVHKTTTKVTTTTAAAATTTITTTSTTIGTSSNAPVIYYQTTNQSRNFNI